MIDKIRTEKQFNQVMELIESYLQKATEKGGFEALTKKETEDLQQLSQLAAAYEQEVLKVWDFPVTIASVIQQKVSEMNITQTKLAAMLGIGLSKVNQILKGKRPPDVPFLKAVHEKLGIDGNFILERV